MVDQTPMQVAEIIVRRFHNVPPDQRGYWVIGPRVLYAVQFAHDVEGRRLYLESLESATLMGLPVVVDVHNPDRFDLIA